MKYLVLTAILFLIPYTSKAQFYVTGDDSGNLKWNTIETRHFKVIYPEENYLLAKKYAFNLEKYSSSISRTSGYEVSGGWGTKMPAVLHTWCGENGSVAWAPKRMDLFTIPSPYSPEPLPWHKMLAIHESRHVTQMQFGMTESMKPFNWFFGEMFNILASLVYPGMATIEGDAVIMETAYTNSGRGRTADFLNYYRVAFDEGIRRDWMKWRYGSQRFYTPNYYALGYIYIGGLRTLYNCPDFTNRMYRLIARKPYRFDAEYAIIESVSGKKQEPAFKEICDTLTKIWTAEADARAPYTPNVRISKEQRLYTNYTNTVTTPDGIFAVKSGFLNSPILIKIDRFGNEEFVRNIAHNISNLNYCEKTGQILWSESTKDMRWGLKAKSLIYSMDSKTGKIRTFRSRKLLHNPAPSPGGNLISTTQYNASGVTGITIIDAETGDWKLSYQAPDSLQIVQTAWSDDGLFASAVSENGYGIYKFDTDKIKWEKVLDPQPVMIDNLDVCEGGLSFVSDLDGENELYYLDLKTNKIIRKTRSRFGLYDYAQSFDKNTVYMSKPSVKGKYIVAMDVKSLKTDTTSFCPQHKYYLAERLTEQEKAFANAKQEDFVSTEPVDISQPKRYKKLPNIFNVHSWAPFYVSPNKIMNMSFDKVYEAISLGATGIIQNRLATAVGEFGYSAHKDPFDRTNWRHSAHAKLTYSGFYPIIEASVDFNDRAARLYTNEALIHGKSARLSMKSQAMKIPSIQGKLSVYVPLSFNSGGWYRGFIPKLTYLVNNDIFDKRVVIRNANIIPGGEPIVHITEGKRAKSLHSMIGTVRFYNTLSTPNSSVYPRWGYGAEIGALGSFSRGDFMSPIGYIYGYGYLPGVIRSQGVKVTAMYQQKLNPSKVFCQNITRTLPRGFAYASTLPSYTVATSPWAVKLTADYGIPIYTGEWPIWGSFIYVKRLVITPHFDMSFFRGLSLFSAGVSAAFDLQTLCWFEWPCSIGITTSVNGSFNGAFRALKNQIDPKIGRFFVGPVFSVSF